MYAIRSYYALNLFMGRMMGSAGETFHILGEGGWNALTVICICLFISYNFV